LDFWLEVSGKKQDHERKVPGYNQVNWIGNLSLHETLLDIRLDSYSNSPEGRRPMRTKGT